MLSRKYTKFIALFSFGLFIFVYKCFQHANFGTGAYDLALYDSAIINTLKGQFLYSSQIERNFLGEHFSPILLLFVPLYFLYSSVGWLFLSQAAAVSIYMFLLTKVYKSIKENISLWDIIFILVPVFFYKRLAEGIKFDFHPEIFSLIFVSLAIIYERQKKFGALLTTLLASILIKEDMALVGLGFSLKLIFDCKTRKLGIYSSILFLGIFAAFTFYLIPQLSLHTEGNRFLLERWGSYGGSLAGIIFGLLTSPLKVLSRIVKANLSASAPLLYLPLLSPSTLLLALPYIGLHGTSDLKSEADLKLHYIFPLIPIFATAFLESVTKLQYFLTFRLHNKFCLPDALSIFIGVYLSIVGFKYSFAYDWQENNLRNQAITLIPKDQTVAAQSPFIPHLIREYRPIMFPNQGSKKYQDTQYLLLDLALPSWPLTTEQLQTSLERLKRSTSWHLIYQKGTVYLFKKR